MSARSQRTKKPFPHAQLLSDRVIKSRPPALAAVEAEKTARAAAIGISTGLFRVPSLLASDPALGTLETERIEDFVQLHEALLRGKDADALVAAAGRALAAIHANLELPEAMRIQLPAPYAAPELGVDVVLHGDFNTYNLFVRSGTRELVITDWETSFQAHRLSDPGPHEVPAIGPRYFDLAWFVVSLFRRNWFGLGRIDRAPERAELFLRSYFVEAGPAARPEGFASYLAGFATRRQSTDPMTVSRVYWLRHPRTPVARYSAARSFAKALVVQQSERGWQGSPGRLPLGDKKEALE